MKSLRVPAIFGWVSIFFIIVLGSFQLTGRSLYDWEIVLLPLIGFLCGFILRTLSEKEARDG